MAEEGERKKSKPLTFAGKLPFLWTSRGPLNLESTLNFNLTLFSLSLGLTALA